METAVHAPPGAAHLMGLSAGEAATLPAVRVLDRLGVTEAGLSGAEATRRLATCGPNAVRAHHARALRVLGRQLRNAVLILLAVTAVVSFFLGDSTNAVIIGVILVASVGLGSVNEYRAERAAQALHSQVRHTAVVLRDARPVEVDVTALVPGDVVRLALGGIVPADLRLLATTGLECDESVLTGESLPVDKTVAPVPSGVASAGPACCALMGTVVRAGGGTSLAAGSRRLARCKVLVKRLVCIEDLGDMDVLVTDKTGTLTEGRIGFVAALAPGGDADDRVLLLGLLATESDLPAEAASAPGADLPAGGSVAVGGNPLDAALWQAPGAPAHLAGGYTRLGLLPFDHERRMTTAVLRAPDGTRVLITKGAPEAVLSRCPDVSAGAAGTLRAQFAAGSRVVAVATRPAAGLTVPTPADERDLILAGFLVFLDRPKEAAATSLRRLAGLGITVKIATGDNPLVAEKVCADLGLTSGGTLTGTDIAALGDDALAAVAETTTIFARVSPEQKARLIRLLRRHGRDVGFLGDGVNDALALHAADVGISVDTATDVAKDAADVVLLEKDLGVLADGVAEGRRIFANTIKYVLMGT
ncbi:HAD-IC family P-type ATPase [Streptosporangium canum]|uniref:cation-translocating P-type ATPase n=1 Tax=Streptosporangium canum TaxID=324952 RepID=UPI0034487B93